MLHSAEPFMLRDGGRCVIRSVEPEDAQRMLQYMPFITKPSHVESYIHFKQLKTRKTRSFLYKTNKNHHKDRSLCGDIVGAVTRI